MSIEETAVPGFQMLVAQLMRRGISDKEAVLAIESLAQAQLDMIATDEVTAIEIDEGERVNRWPEEPGPPSEKQRWALVFDALMWSLLAATTILLGLWWGGFWA